jgi:hypothetical protein
MDTLKNSVTLFASAFYIVADLFSGDASNASGLDNGQSFPSLGSRDKPEQGQDGSTILYLEPKAPEGRASNWLWTVPGKFYSVILRLYGPLEGAIDRIWKPGDWNL